MRFRSREVIEQWVREFGRLGYPEVVDYRVIDQDTSEGANAGLVVVEVTGVNADAWIQPNPQGGTLWHFTIEARPEPLTLTPAEVQRLASTLITVSSLTAFLEARSLSHGDDDA